MDAKQFDAYAESLSKPDLVRSLVQAKASFDVAVGLLDTLSSDASPETKEQACSIARSFVDTYRAAEEEASQNG